MAGSATSSRMYTIINSKKFQKRPLGTSLRRILLARRMNSKAIAIAFVFIRLANKMRRSDVPKGRFWNFLELMIVYIRDEVAEPAIGHHDANRFLPFLWTVFFFILGCNLFGLLPWPGSPTASLSCTGALAIVAF